MFFNFLLRLSLQFKNYLNLFEFHSLIFFLSYKGPDGSKHSFFFWYCTCPKNEIERFTRTQWISHNSNLILVYLNYEL